MTAFTTVLIANRGEIACRILRSVHALGYRSVAVYSDADAEARHVQLADLAVHIGPAPVRDSYLDKNRLLDAARRAGADAIHPGYGFLSEDAEFAAACAQAGLVFIGPPPAAIHAMGNKAHAKRRMIAAGVPCVPGFQDSSEQGQSDARLLAEAAEVGYPILIKAAAGGGGRGMRLCADPSALPAALSSARSESLGAFGSGELILERALLGARHVEIQVFADRHGHVIHLGERDCSIQRRHQKVIEEAPSPAVDPELRGRMGAAAVQAARAIAYEGAGTVEFLLDQRGDFYFLEMNTRLQVEHPVTEAITGLDLVELQLRVAAGEPLPLTQDQLQQGGHAIEARLYAEDPYQNFLPGAGPVHLWIPPQGPGVRVDHGLAPGQPVTPYYDPMVAKVIAHGPTREHARRRLARALESLIFFGPATNQRFLLDLLRAPAFIEGAATTNFIEHQLDPSARQRPLPLPRHWALAALLWARRGRPGERTGDPWRSSGPIATPLDLALLGDGAPKAHLRLTFTAPDVLLVEGAPGAAAPLRLHVLEDSGVHLRVDIDGLQRRIAAHLTDADTEADAQPALYLSDEGHTFTFREVSPKGARPGAEPLPGDGTIRAPTSGRLVALPHLVGARVAPADVVAIVEAMKIETSLNAGVHGTITSHHAELGALLRPGALLVTIQPDEAQS
jgi:geranyl-CoA carboxylase alpha subunit